MANNVGMYDHFSNPSSNNKGTGLWKNIKDTKIFSENLQITEKKSEEKGVPSALLSIGHNSINSIAAPIVDYANKISTRVSNIIKPIYTATIGSPKITYKENGFFKGGAKLAGSTVVGTAGLVTDTLGSAAQTPAKVYERLVNSNVQDTTDVMHLFSKKLRGMDKAGFKTILPGFVDGAANSLKILSKMGGYASGVYALNWLGKYLNKGADISQEYVKLKNVEIEKSRKIENKDPSVMEA